MNGAMILGVAGHRFQKLRGIGAAQLRSIAKDEIQKISPTWLISGMALGWDQACVEAAIELRIPYWAMVPFPGFDERWTERQRTHLRELLALAENVVVVRQVKPNAFGAVAGALNARNRRVVDLSAKILACWDGKDDGGTASALRYADLKKKPVINVFDRVAA